MTGEIEMKVLLQPEVTQLLRRNIGTHRSWREFLADCIRGKTDFYGLTLLPVVCIKPGGKHKTHRPLYDPRDVGEFIKAAKLVAPPDPDRDRIQVTTVSVDPTPGLPWTMRRATLLPTSPPP